MFASPRASSCSSAYSRTVSSIPNRGSPSAPIARWTRLLSTSPCNRSSTSSAGRACPFASLRACPDIGAGPERCRSAERYSRSAGACESKDIPALEGLAEGAGSGRLRPRLQRVLAVLGDPGGKLGTAAQPQPGVDPLQVVADRRFLKDQLLGDLAVRQTSRYQPGHLG